MDEIFTALVDEVFRLNGALLAEGDRLASTSGLTAARWQVLGRVADQPTTVAAIARTRGLKRQSVQETVVRLERDGLVERTANPLDQRAPIVTITQAGIRALDGIEPARAQWANSVPSRIAIGDLERTLATLRIIRETLP